MNNSPSYGLHISKQFNTELLELKTQMLKMGGLVENQVKDSIHALVNADSKKAEHVCLKDKGINFMEISIDEQCARTLALRQPAASDLRLVIVILKTITDLERIGDESSKIARQAIHLTENSDTTTKGYIEIRHLGNHVLEMIHDALDAFARLDVQLAFEVAQKDKAVDLEYRTAMRAMVTFMMEDPRSISRVLNIVWCLRALERIGDHARNIAEYVVYLANGKDIRHTGLQGMAEEVKEIEKITNLKSTTSEVSDD